MRNVEVRKVLVVGVDFQLGNRLFWRIEKTKGVMMLQLVGKVVFPSVVVFVQLGVVVDFFVLESWLMRVLSQINLADDIGDGPRIEKRTEKILLVVN